MVDYLLAQFFSAVKFIFLGSIAVYCLIGFALLVLA